MNLDFLHAPVDFQTTYFLVFGVAAIYAVVMLVLVRLDDRRKRNARGSRTNSTNPQSPTPNPSSGITEPAIPARPRP